MKPKKHKEIKEKIAIYLPPEKQVEFTSEPVFALPIPMLDIGPPEPIIDVKPNVIPILKPPIIKFNSMELKEKYKKKDKVAIIGFADSKDEAPYTDDTWEVWGLNSLFESIPRWDLWFEIHERKAYKMDTNKEIGYGLTRTGEPYMEALGKLNQKGIPTPIFMVDKYDDLPNSVRFPIEDIISKFDPSLSRKEYKDFHKIDWKYEWNGYFTNSISYMIALAIDWGYPEIGIWGVDMATLSEYGSQRPSCEYYLGIAVGKGVKVTIPNTADLLKCRNLYGMEDEKKNIFNDKIAKLTVSMQQRLNEAHQNFELTRKQVDQYIGAIECAKEMMKIWGTN